MERWKRRRPEAVDSGSDTLRQLLEREQRLAVELEDAKAEAEQLLAEAHAYSRERDAACDAVVEERIARLAAAHEAELQSDLRSIEERAAREARRFDEADTALTTRLVAIVLESIGALPEAPVASG
jgi:hypothetical protein